MIKYYCDRCGRELSDAVGDDVEIDISSLALVTHGRVESGIHLCKNCFDAFIDEFIFGQKEEFDGKK